jgi:nucleotide-binding universal stress UspA family protein
MFKHILIPTDGSDLSRKAIPYGVQLAKESGAKVTGLTVTEPC